MPLQYLRIACLVPLITLACWTRETTLMKTIQEVGVWIQGTRFMEILNGIRNHNEEDLGIILIIFKEYWMPPCILKHITRMHEWEVNVKRRLQQAIESRLFRLLALEEPAGPTVLVDQNTATADTHEEEPITKLEEEDAEGTLDVLDIPDDPATPNTPTTTALPNTPDDSDSSDISAGTYQPDDSPRDHRAYEARRTNRMMPPREGLERPRSILESLGWVKVAGSGHEMESGMDGDMARHE